MRILFIGASDLGRACCEALLSDGQNVAGILTAPREFRISWSPASVTNVRHASFDDLAARHGIPLAIMSTRMNDCATWLAERNADLLVVIGWYHMIGRALRELARYGAVGLHASLLPKYRGGAPLVWAMIHGERQTGVTLFHLGDGVDDGDIIGQEVFPILDSDTIADLVARSTESALRLVRRCIPELAAGTAPRTPQNHAAATTVPQRRPADGLLDPATKSARQAYDWVRAQTRPYPGAFFVLGGQSVTIWRATVDARRAPATLRPGEFALDEPLLVCAGGTLLRLDEVQIANDVLNGEELLQRMREILR